MNRRLSAPQKKFLFFLVTIIPVYAVVTAFFHVTGPFFIKASLPMVKTIIVRSYPETELINLEYSDEGGRRLIKYTMKITKWINGIDIPLIDYLNISLYISSQFVTAIIFYTLLFSWPFISMKKRLIAAVVMIPLIVLFIFLDTPISAVIQTEIECQRKLPGYVLQETLHGRVFLFFGHFFNNGGRQFLGIFFFILSIIPFHLSPAMKTGDGSVGRNYPCPCGSGKKYKNCCL